MVTTLPTTCRNDLLGPTFPVESPDFDLLSDDERREWTCDVLLEHDQEGPVLLILPVRVDERLLDEATQAHRGTRRAFPPSGPASWSSCGSHRLTLAVEARAFSAGPPARQPLHRIVNHAQRTVQAPDPLVVAEDQHDTPVAERDLTRAS